MTGSAAPLESLDEVTYRLAQRRTRSSPTRIRSSPRATVWLAVRRWPWMRASSIERCDAAGPSVRNVAARWPRSIRGWRSARTGRWSRYRRRHGQRIVCRCERIAPSESFTGRLRSQPARGALTAFDNGRCTSGEPGVGSCDSRLLRQLGDSCDRHHAAACTRRVEGGSANRVPARRRRSAGSVAAGDDNQRRRHARS